jgi:hypothetical protein
MPKLRGIDTRGTSKTDCLDRIRAQINEGIGGNSFNLAEDFDLACELGHGQFIWQSANYLNEAEQTQDPETNKASDIDLSEPPPGYCAKDTDRLEKWSEKSQKQKRMHWDKANE